jgi:hypothetical protein
MATGRHATRGASRATARSAAQRVHLPAHPGDLTPQRVTLPDQVRQLGAHRLTFRARGRAGLAADLGRLLLRGLEDVLHAVGEAADRVALVAPRARTGARAGRRGQAGAGAEPRRRHERERLTTRRLQVGAHPRKHPLQPCDVLVDLLPVVSAQNDVEAWGAWPPHICRHRDALPLVPFTSTRVGIIRFPQPVRSLLRSIPNRYRSPAGGVLPQVSRVRRQ